MIDSFGARKFGITANHKQIELFDLVPGEDRVSLALHSGLNLRKGENFWIRGEKSGRDTAPQRSGEQESLATEEDDGWAI